MKIGSLFTGIGGLELGVCDTGALTKGAYDVLLDALNEADYSTSSVVLPASSLGMPHKRARIFVFAERTERWVIPFNDQLVKVRPDTRLRCLPTPNRSRMDGRKSLGYSKRPSFYDLKQWSEDEVRASYGAPRPSVGREHSVAGPLRWRNPKERSTSSSSNG